MEKLVHRFNNHNNKSIINSKDMLGGKGANLAQMAKLKLPVPPGFTISTKVCDYFYKNNKKLPKKIIQQAKKEITIIEKSKGVCLLHTFCFLSFAIGIGTINH